MSTASWFCKTSHTPSHPTMTNSSRPLSSTDMTSGVDSTSAWGTFQSMSPNALETARPRGLPPLLVITLQHPLHSTLPFAFSMRILSASASGLWSTLSGIALPPLDSTARASPKLATCNHPSKSKATFAVAPPPRSPWAVMASISSSRRTNVSSSDFLIESLSLLFGSLYQDSLSIISGSLVEANCATIALLCPSNTPHRALVLPSLPEMFGGKNLSLAMNLSSIEGRFPCSSALPSHTPVHKESEKPPPCGKGWLAAALAALCAAGEGVGVSSSPSNKPSISASKSLLPSSVLLWFAPASDEGTAAGGWATGWGGWATGLEGWEDGMGPFWGDSRPSTSFSKSSKSSISLPVPF
mmetsp:Transcript_4428/g.10694  ORF Transcript_4428/g.10694 Transcript_4428/m.10694 type:complete len:355 (-) Transcript_4428:39-1103(-)